MKKLLPLEIWRNNFGQGENLTSALWKVEVQNIDWRDMLSTWARCGLAGVFPMRGRQMSGIGRVQAVSRVSPSAPLDPSRWLGQENLIVRPDVRDIASQDIVFFNSLLDQRPLLKGKTNDKLGTMVINEVSQADRIHATLVHLRAVKGL